MATMHLTIGEKIVWGQAFHAAMSTGLRVTQASIEASKAVLALREVPYLKTWEGVNVDPREKDLACLFALSMTHD